MVVHISAEQRRAILEEVGYTILRVERCKGSHYKLYCEYHGREVFFVTSVAQNGRDQRAYKNFRTQALRVQRAIDDGDEELLARTLRMHPKRK